MSLEVAIQENTNAIRALIAALANGVPTTAAQVSAVVTEAKPEKAAKKEAAKTETKVKEKATETTQAAEQKPEALTQMTAAEAEKALHGHANNPADAPTYQATADAVTKLARTKGRDAAVAVLNEFGAAKLPDIQPHDFQKVIDACTEAAQ